MLQYLGVSTLCVGSLLVLFYMQSAHTAAHCCLISGLLTRSFCIFLMFFSSNPKTKEKHGFDGWAKPMIPVYLTPSQ